MAGDDSSRNYKDTLFLPRTDFPMRAKLPQREPRWLEKWERDGLYRRLRERAKGRPRFHLHDGPPYANGDIHIGTAMNKVLKDVIVRAKQMNGYDAPYVPGWDCHGLPIEWKIEESYREQGRSKDEVDPVEFRRECRHFAEHWIEVQREQFKRLGVIGNWQQPYTTMSYAAEARIVEELLKFARMGALYRGARPVMWSPVEKTALADAEIEYHEHTATQIDVAFPVVKTDIAALADAAVVIWTTTPWTIPGNRAIAYGDDVDYTLVAVDEVAADARIAPGRKLVVAEGLLPALAERAGITVYGVLERFKGRDFAGTVCAHPWRGRGYDFEVPLLPGAHVTVEQGSGFVHTAPGHGEEDFEVGKRFDLEVPHTVGDDGRFYAHVPLVAGEHVYEVDDKICEVLGEAGALLAASAFRHSYPHSWRSKAPLIFRNTAQWFISMAATGLREAALQGVETTRWIPEHGRNRMRGMIEARPDWVISRQRAWGVPLTLFAKPETGELLVDEEVNARIVEAVRQEGADAWFSSPPERFLGERYSPEAWQPVTDIIDVWFDSGATHSFVLEDRSDLDWPASLYIEGSDQHRGWFQSSLLESCGTRGRPPYDAVLTHGFVLDPEGRKMSKSLGNVVAPQDVIDQYGADILRLWTIASDYFADVRIGDEILRGQVDAYRKIRNTLRFMLGNLADFEASERVPAAEMPELERWVLHRLQELDAEIRRRVEDFDFTPYFQALYHFCISDLSAFYFDIRKDALYCDAETSPRRRAARTVLDLLFYRLTTWLAPLLAFTAEEVWLSRFGETAESVHLQLFPETPASWRDDALVETWRSVRSLRRVVNGALEVARRDKQIGASLEASPLIYIRDEGLRMAASQVDMAEICITSGIALRGGAPPETAYTLDDVDGVGVVVERASGEKCARCWQHTGDVGSDPAHPDICARCTDVVRQRAGATEA